MASDGVYDITLVPFEEGWHIQEVGHPGLLVVYTPHPPQEETILVEDLISCGRQIVPGAFREPLFRDTTPPGLLGVLGIPVPAALGAILTDLNLLESNDPIENAGARIQDAFTRWGTDALGWYQSCHEYDEGFWGIYLHLPSIGDLSRLLLGKLVESGCGGNLSDTFCVVSRLVYEHEQFHSRVDFLALGQELACRRALRSPTKNTCIGLRGSGRGLLRRRWPISWASRRSRPY